MWQGGNTVKRFIGALANSLAGILLPGILLAGHAGALHAAEPLSDVGLALQAAGAPQFITDAGDAIRKTCLELGAAGTQTGERSDLFNRCREMSGTVINGLGAGGAGSSYGFTNPTDIFNSIRQFSGEETSSQSRLATESTNRQFANLGARMDAIRRGARASTPSAAFQLHGLDIGNAIAGTASPRPMTGGGASADRDARDADIGWGWFANGAIGWGDRDETVNESGYDFDSYGLTFGTDYAFGNGLTLGTAIGYTKYDVDLDRSSIPSQVGAVAGGGIESDGYTLSGFFVYALDRYYVNGIVSYGRNDFDLERRASFAADPDAIGTAVGVTIDRLFEASTDSTQYAGQLTGGTILGQAATTLDLYAGIDYLRLEIDRFQEREIGPADSGLALAFAKQKTDSVQSIVGAMVRHAISTRTGVLVPYAGVEWRHEFDNDSRGVEYRYVFAVPGSTVSFVTPTDDPETNFFDVTLGVSGQFANNLVGWLQYNTALGIDDATTHVVTLGIRGVF
jgi:outer membrane lipase/esterase